VSLIFYAFFSFFWQYGDSFSPPGVSGCFFVFLFTQFQQKASGSDVSPFGSLFPGISFLGHCFFSYFQPSLWDSRFSATGLVAIFVAGGLLFDMLSEALLVF